MYGFHDPFRAFGDGERYGLNNKQTKFKASLCNCAGDHLSYQFLSRPTAVAIRDTGSANMQTRSPGRKRRRANQASSLPDPMASYVGSPVSAYPSWNATDFGGEDSHITDAYNDSSFWSHQSGHHSHDIYAPFIPSTPSFSTLSSNYSAPIELRTPQTQNKLEEHNNALGASAPKAPLIDLTDESFSRRPSKAPVTTARKKQDITSESRGEDPEKSKKLKELLKALECPVCWNSCKDITSTHCGHVFCRGCLVASVRKYGSCPLCAQKLTLANIHPLFL